MTYPAPVPKKYTVSPGDSFHGTAQRLYGDSGFASTIAGMNGFPLNNQLAIGQILLLPQYLPNTNNANNVTPYEHFISIMQGSLSPHLNLKQANHHHGIANI